MDLNDIPIEARAYKAYQTMPIDGPEWREVMLRYRQKLNEWSFTSYNLWLVSAVLSIALTLFLPTYWNLIGIILCLLSGWQLGAKYSVIDGFQTGYEWGKEEGSLRALDIPKENELKLLNEIRNLETENI